MKLNVEIRNQQAVQDVLAKLSGPQAREAYAKALNDAGFQVRREMQAALRSSFDRVTPWVERSPKVFAATADKLSVSVAPTISTSNAPSKGGKVGMDPQKVLQAQEFGGRRADKRSESALRRAGILPSGFQTSIPRTPYPGSDDGRGNLRGAFVTQLLSYLQAYSEQGFKANMSDKRKARLRNQQGIGSIATKKVNKTTLGVRYFVSHGRMRGQHLAPGIWAAKGTHDVQVAPVLMFVRRPSYQPRISMDSITKQADLQNYLDKRVRFRVRQAAGI
ncbi:hypothetical protein J8G26_08970 [Acidovorax sp. JG5]|uniref:hypothetical protein n=1 Tax=Acidovorax sp. JG5 TaxID=2822718 RepID=UPI001B336A6A|nr:hypothetical protein [Acidovorax sp. JG5]MBP3980858.1 hypothetical protein [Acidovorax sp. JG5]